MRVAICIVAFRNPDDIRSCVEALEMSEFQDFEVVISENGGGDAFSVLAALLPTRLRRGQNVRLVQAPGNLGYAGGVNLCLEMAQDVDAWWILNPDTRPEPPALRRMVERLQRGDSQMVGCTTYFPSGTVEARGGRWRPWLARAISIDNGVRVDRPVNATDIERQIDYVSGASMLVSRAFVSQAGVMREDYFLYGEEVEWCLRGRALGLQIGLAGDAKVLHNQGTTTGSVAEFGKRSRISVFLDERNKILITRDRTPNRVHVVALAALVMICLRFGRRGAWRQLKFGIEGWWAGISDVRGKPPWFD